MNKFNCDYWGRPKKSPKKSVSKSNSTNREQHWPGPTGVKQSKIKEVNLTNEDDTELFKFLLKTLGTSLIK